MNRTKRFAKRALSLILMLVMLMSVMVAGAAGTTAVTTDTAQTGAETGAVKTLYFSPNGYWSNLYAIYVWEDGMYDQGEWKSFSKIDGAEGVYSVEIGAEYTKAIFCSRTVPGFDWEVVDYKTDAVTIPEGYNYLSLVGETTVMWSFYNAGDLPENPTGTQKIYFVPNEEWTDIQSALYHSFVLRAWNDLNADSIWAEFELIEGEFGTYPGVWVAQIPGGFDNVQFCRAEGSAEGGWYVWESTEDQTVPADSNCFTQDADAETGTWSYYVAEDTDPDTPDPDQPDDPTPDIPVNPGETKRVYFTPNAEWITYTADSSGRISAASWGSDNVKTWVWAEKVSGKIYAVDIPADDTSILFGVSFGATADVAWAVTDNQTIPADNDHFTQNATDTSTGTWGTYKEEVTGTSYSVVFVDWDNSLISAQVVVEGGAATAPEAPTRDKDSQFIYTFKGWDTAFDKVTSDIIVKALYDATPLPQVERPTVGTLKIEISGGAGFTISVNNGAARPQGNTYLNSKAPVGATVTVIANSTNDAEFLGWVNPANGSILTKELTYTFIASGNDFYKAMFSTDVQDVQMVKFVNTKAGSNGQFLDVQYYSAEDTIVFPADPMQVGLDFTGWNMTETEIKAAIAQGNDVTVEAQWKKQVIPVNVTVTGGTGSGVYAANYPVTIVANSASAGQKFAYWTDTEGTIKSYKSSYKFYPYEDVTLVAIFVPESTVIEEQIIVSLDTIDTTSIADRNVFYYTWYVPANYEFVDAGIIAVNKVNYNESTFYAGTSDANVYDRGPSGANIKPDNSYTWTKSNVAEGDTWVAKAYVQYRVNGEIVTLYSQLVEAVK